MWLSACCRCARPCPSYRSPTVVRPPSVCAAGLLLSDRCATDEGAQIWADWIGFCGWSTGLVAVFVFSLALGFLVGVWILLIFIMLVLFWFVLGSD